MKTKKNAWALTDLLSDLTRRFADHAGEPVSINEQGVEWWRDQLTLALTLARELENENSALKWNRLGNPDVPDHVIEAACRPGSNVVLLGRMSVPFSDGRPRDGGSAA